MIQNRTYNIPIIIVHFLAIFFSINLLDAQESSYKESTISNRQFDQEQWEKTTAPFDYSAEVVPTPKPEKEKKEEKEDRTSSPLFSIGPEAATLIMKFIVILSAIIVLTLILRSLLGFGLLPRNRKISQEPITEIDLEVIEENIHETDLDKFIHQALQQKNYPLAIRLYYLAILKELSVQNEIKWKKDKTNRDYFSELKGSTFIQPFREITNIFERVWYGNTPITEQDFHQIEPFFKRLLEQLNAQATI